MHVNFGGYHVSDIKFVAAFDVDANKVGKDLAEAIFTPPNCVAKFCEVPKIGVEVKRGPVLDGLGKYLRTVVPVDPSQEPVDVAEVLKESRAEILVNYLPVGSYEGTRYYAQEAIKAKCAFINCMPEFIASDKEWAKKFEEVGLPCAGDDIKSQLGATILHRTLAKLFIDRGVKIEESYQLNIGGNTDFLNMLEEERLTTKRISKTEAVSSQVPYEVPLRIGPSDYVPFLRDKKICYIHMRGRKFGDLPIELEAKLTVEDSPNSAGVVIDAIRGVKLALDRGISGPLMSISAYFFKHPPIQMSDEEAKRAVEEFIEGKRDR